jgi:chemotaxis signal transduction protein
MDLTPTPTEPTAAPRRPARAAFFGLGGRLFAVPGLLCREFVGALPVTFVPNAPPLLLGIAELRGAILPVVDLQPLFGGPLRTAAPSTRALVVGPEGLRAAWAIDEIVGFEPYEAPGLEPEAAEPSAEPPLLAPPVDLTLGWLRRDEGPVAVLDVLAILERFRARS